MRAFIRVVETGNFTKPAVTLAINLRRLFEDWRIDWVRTLPELAR
jgi:hypothetical protein